ncbi:tRNA uracil 4-sulfurtransferase ThiI [Thermofilum pendens]|uniref:tRNA sulfurtransferase n=1 Tax=Thermofilum pendens (strain DSM 2475 / Hrk 5) TaxID=368408 RepID=A1RWZ9_THEPD|nr:tRNA uracil 4-sulfurtransferase ThiI [Thermofilum pendens]ABL77729.1 thiamine biosynthesis/tRNA modification protein ThiI [Thermofilum pendens Hrk 5]
MEGLREVFVVRLGEITVKSKKSRERFEKRLLENIRDALSSSGVSGEVRREYGRIYVYAPSSFAGVLRRVFGITSFSMALEYEFKALDDIASTVYNLYCDKLKGKTFAVRARRTGDHPFTSMDVARKVGEKLYPCSSGVDLSNPEVQVFIEVRGSRAYFYTDVVRGYGGLPVGSEGKVLALISGGYDSAVAAWYMLKRGAEVHYLYCNMAGDLTKSLVLSVAKKLADSWSYGYKPRLYVADFSPLLRELRAKVAPELFGVVLKRYMYRVAEAIAGRIGAIGIVTGESLGQVSSQTLENLYVASQATSMPIYRPLIGFDKEEIISKSKEIGTYEESSKVKEVCGVFSVHPKTRSRLEEVEREESKLDPAILGRVLSTVEEIDLRSATPSPLIEVDVDAPPEGSIIVDVRPKEKYEEGHIPGSLHIEFTELPLFLERLDKSKTYVFVCDEGGLSREAAYMLRKAGFNAWSLKGGLRRFSRLARESSG